jgi:hypothetical protein
VVFSSVILILISTMPPVLIRKRIGHGVASFYLQSSLSGTWFNQSYASRENFGDLELLSESSWKIGAEY